MGLFSSKKSKNKYVTLTSKSKLTVDIVDDNKWKKCNQCNEIIYNEDLKNNLNVCPKCGNYFRLTAFERIELLIDEGTFMEEDMTLNSKNVLNAIEAAKAKGMKVIAMTGKDGGKMAGLADVEIRVPHFRYADRIQEIHIKVIHILMMLIESEMAKDA